MANQVSLRDSYKNHLKVLTGFRLIFICDDSTSMLKTLNYTNNKRRRWDELKETLTVLLDFLSQESLQKIIKISESKVMFLNNEKDRSNFQIQSKAQIKEQIEKQFSIEPLGQTPLTSCFKNAINSKKSEEKLLVIILTDGRPTETSKSESAAIQNFKTALENKDANTHVTIVACTDNAATMSYLNDWDNNIANLDVLDDYESEKKLVLAANDSKFEFTFSDYIGKILLGSIVPELDSLDGFYARE